MEKHTQNHDLVWDFTRIWTIYIKGLHTIREMGSDGLWL